MRIDDGELQLDQSLATVKGTISDLKEVGLTVGAESPDIRKLIKIQIPGSQPLPISLTGELHLQDREIALRRLTGSIFESSTTVTGSFSLGGAGADDALEATFNLSGQSSRSLEKLFGLETKLPDGQVSMVAEIRGRDGLYRAVPLEITYGKSDLQGSLDLHLDDELEVHAILRSDYLYLPFLAPDLKNLEAEEQARIAAGVKEEVEDYEDALTSEELKERIIPDVLFQLDWLRRLNGTLVYSIEELFIKEGTKNKGSLALELQEGKLTVNTGRWDSTYSAGSYAMALDASKEIYEFSFQVDGERLPLLWLLGGEPDHERDSMYKARLSGRGNTAREVAASLNGAMIFRAKGGKLNNQGLDLIFGDLFDEILNSLNPQKRPRTYTEIVCNAGALAVNDGVVEAIPGLILRTDKTDLLAAGNINLKTERMDMAFSTRARKGLGISAGRTLSRHLRLGGTLANPRLTLDTTAMAVSSGAALATAGWSILASGAWDRWVATAGDPCKRLINQARKDPKRDYHSLL